MAWMVVRSSAVSIALALAGSVVCAQSPQSPARAAQNDEAIAQRNAQQNTRIVSLLEQLAEQARASENLGFAVRAQSQAAKLLWTQDPDRARTIYQRAFQSLAPSTSSKSRENTESAEASRTDATKVSAGRGPSLAEKRQLRTELLNQIAARDPELAEELARSLADPIEISKSGCADGASIDCGSTGGTARPPLGPAPGKSREEAERCELIMSAALQVVDRDPQQAMAFAQMSVASGISSNLARLLSIMRTVDAERADLLFSNAMDRLERASQVDLADVHTLGSYVVSAVNPGSKEPLSRPLVLRFLNFGFDQLVRREPAPPRSARLEDSAAFYFVGRQLTDLFARYLPYRLDQLQRYVSDQSDAGVHDQAIDPVAQKVSAPGDIARDAIQTTDPVERDSLYARAALAWLAQAEVREAQSAALKISDAATRDRVLAPIVRRHSYEKRIEDAVALARRITDDTSRVELLVMLGGAARASKDTARAVELLNEAAAYSLKARPTLDRARSLVKIASSFSAFDTLRSFEVLQSAVKAINDLSKQQEDSKEELSAPGTRAKIIQAFALEELNATFESTLAALAKADFESALALARQLPSEEASVIAQLAACGGGLAAKPSRVQSTGGDEVDSGLNH